MQDAHTKFGHCGEEYARSTAKSYGWNITGTLKPCESCGIGKMKQSSVSKELKQKSVIPGERWFMDITSIAVEDLAGTKFWLGFLDDCTDFFKSYSIKQKSDVKDILPDFIRTLKVSYNKNQKYFRCDDAGEN